MSDSPQSGPEPSDEPAAPLQGGKHQTKPFDIDTMPPGIPFIIGNEAAERFSFYGMRAILYVFMFNMFYVSILEEREESMLKEMTENRPNITAKMEDKEKAEFEEKAEKDIQRLYEKLLKSMEKPEFGEEEKAQAVAMVMEEIAPKEKKELKPRDRVKIEGRINTEIDSIREGIDPAETDEEFQKRIRNEVESLYQDYIETKELAKIEAKIWQHNFITAAYFFPILGALLCDWLFGKYRTIMWLSVVYCGGHLMMALVDFPQYTGISEKTCLFWGLALIAIGTGGIKPCVSAHVGDQFGPRNAHLLPQVFRWFYFSINFGSFFAYLLIPRLRESFGPGVAFGVPGVLMAIATVLFWMGRNRFVHIPPTGSRLLSEIVSPAGLRAIFNLVPLYIFIAVFWCLFDQTTSEWVEQAKSMNRNVFGLEINPSETQALNPFLVLVLIPVCSYFVYPAIDKFFPLTPLRKIGIGLFLTVPAFALPAWYQMRIDAGETPHIAWHLIAYIFMTAAEVMISITALEFSYTQAPKTMKSFIMGLFLLSVALGNKFTVWVNEYMKSQREAGNSILEGASYYWFFTAAMLITALLYVVASQFFRTKTYIQGDDETPDVT